jgi:hypothetical protein
MAQYECREEACEWIGDEADLDGEQECPACGGDVREVREYTPAEQAEILQRANNLLRRYGLRYKPRQSIMALRQFW